MRVKLLLGMTLIGLCGVRRPALARSSDGTIYQIYSWKSGNDWMFSLLPTQKDASDLTAVEIKQTGGMLRGTSKVKEKLLGMKEGDQILWKEKTDSGMVYPPAPVIEDVQSYAQSVGVKVSIPQH